MALTVGETLSLCLTVAGAASVELRLGGESVASHAMTGSGNEWSVNVDTVDMAPGRYRLQVWATYASGNKKVVYNEQLTLAAALAEGETRTNAAVALENIDAMLGGQAKEGVKSYQINNRQLERYSIAELLQLRSHFAAIVAKERRKERGQSTLGPRIAFRF